MKELNILRIKKNQISTNQPSEIASTIELIKELKSFSNQEKSDIKKSYTRHSLNI